MEEHIKEFAAAATDYCAWCESAPSTEFVEARAALDHLSRLYLLAQRLRQPEGVPEIDVDRPSDAVWRGVFERCGALPFNYYQTLLSPLELGSERPECGMADLADDLADIYRDLSHGLSILRLGHPESAEWEWSSSFWSHWGRHAVAAMHSLHGWFAEHRVS
jgi:hypothetical protein